MTREELADHLGVPVDDLDGAAPQAGKVASASPLKVTWAGKRTPRPAHRFPGSGIRLSKGDRVMVLPVGDDVLILSTLEN